MRTAHLQPGDIRRAEEQIPHLCPANIPGVHRCDERPLAAAGACGCGQSKQALHWVSFQCALNVIYLVIHEVNL